MSSGICGKPQVLLLQLNICCLLPKEFLSWNQDQLYHILFLSLHRVFFFEFFCIKCTQIPIWTRIFVSLTSLCKQTCWLFLQLLLLTDEKPCLYWWNNLNNYHSNSSTGGKGQTYGLYSPLLLWVWGTVEVCSSCLWLRKSWHKNTKEKTGIRNWLHGVCEMSNL